jgi:hypothetical protein
VFTPKIAVLILLLSSASATRGRVHTAFRSCSWIELKFGIKCNCRIGSTRRRVTSPTTAAAAAAASAAASAAAAAASATADAEQRQTMLVMHLVARSIENTLMLPPTSQFSN